MKQENLLKIFNLFIIIIIIGVISYNKYVNDNKENIEIETEDSNIIFKLQGDAEVNIYEGDNYTDLGYILCNQNNEPLDYQVSKNDNININKVGSYNVTYSVVIDEKNYEIERTINVLKNPIKNVEFSLKGANAINIIVGEKFNDPLFICYDKETKEDLSSNVKTNSNLNNNKVGNYRIEYTLKINGKEKTILRNVNVLKEKYSFSYNNKLTNDDVAVVFQSYIPNFSYIKTPDNNIHKESKLTYNISNNGVYKFYVYDFENNYEEYQVSINNIDKAKPTLKSCVGTISNFKYQVKAVTQRKW